MLNHVKSINPPRKLTWKLLQEGLDAPGAPPLHPRASTDAAGGAQDVHGQDVRNQQLGARLRPNLLRVYGSLWEYMGVGKVEAGQLMDINGC